MAVVGELPKLRIARHISRVVKHITVARTQAIVGLIDLRIQDPSQLLAKSAAAFAELVKAGEGRVRLVKVPVAVSVKLKDLLQLA